LTDTREQDRFVALLDANRGILYKVAASYARSPADRQDLAQKIVVQLWRAFGRYDDRFQFSTWMYRVALNVSISFYRSESRRARHTVPAEDSILEIAAPAAGPEGDDLRLLRELIERLDELDRALVILYLDGHRHDAIAEVLGMSETNVGTRIGRIKQRLRRGLKQTA